MYQAAVLGDVALDVEVFLEAGQQREYARPVNRRQPASLGRAPTSPAKATSSEAATTETTSSKAATPIRGAPDARVSGVTPMC